MESSQVNHDRARVKILSVDDDELNQIFIKEVLGDLYEVQAAMDGEDALEVVNQFKPDVILLDVMMPGINGYDVCRAIRNTPNHNRVKIIFTSAKTRPKEREEGYMAGGNDYISKPFSYDELIGKINVFSQMQRVEDERQTLARENERLRAHVRLLGFLNHARHNYQDSDEFGVFTKALLTEFINALDAEAGLLVSTHKELGIQHAVYAQPDVGVEDVSLDNMSIEAGVLANVLESYKPVVSRNLNASWALLGLPDKLSEVQSLLGVSFSISDDEKGAVVLVNKYRQHAFSDDDMALVESLVVEVEHVFRGKR